MSARDRAGRADQAFVPLRSQVRGRVLPVLEETLGPGVAEALARTADQLRDDADLLDELAADLLDRAGADVPERAHATPDLTLDTPDLARAAPDLTRAAPDLTRATPDLTLDAALLHDAHPALRRRALRLAALAVGCPPSDTSARHVDALDALVVAWAGQGPVHLPGGARARRACGRLFLRAAPTDVPDGRTGVRPPSTTQE
ncbi:TilS substrate-binding domain-containing protein [Promicromonospora sp. NPDC050880]|uniref:TilS substrate-binding domain-containing protein n=1 Tax=Promicromonospora sp. NPDC050880 TaxID=3364406 RepID=UPI00379C2314